MCCFASRLPSQSCGSLVELNKIGERNLPFLTNQFNN
uniref:Uncharacterized protein n=2 Tax=unclassified Caudoviricetes TaxID=2788787 RepID=A0A8S5PHM4_9CAUD|nr:MAG TPA: hypothetical protein [Siphoviridae sp. ctJcm18]DAE06574.1 MAG TPA: hypothetical protein [Siphoviridae sp. ctUGQ45]